MGPGLLGQWPILAGDGIVHPRDLVLDTGDRLGGIRYLLPEGLALGPRLLGPRNELGPAGVSIDRHLSVHTLATALLRHLRTEQRRYPAAGGRMASTSVSSQVAPVDQPVTVTVRGLPAGARTTTVRRQVPTAAGVVEKHLRPAKGGIYGNLYLPRHTAGRRPAVLVFGGSGGALTTNMAAWTLRGRPLPALRGTPQAVIRSSASTARSCPPAASRTWSGRPVPRSTPSPPARAPTAPPLRSPPWYRDAGHLVGGLTAWYGSLTGDALTSSGGTVAGTQAAQADAHAMQLAFLAAQ